MTKEIQTKTTAIPAVTFNEFEPTSYEKWKEEATAALKGAPFEKKLFTNTYENITLHPIYTMGDVEDLTHPLAFPGAADFIRGTQAGGYLANPWVISQGIDATNPADFNTILQKELQKGVTGINLVLDKASRQCTPFDATAQEVGLSLITLEDLKAVLKDIDLTAHDLHVFAGASAVPMMGLVAAYAGADVAQLKGCIGADPVAVLAQDGQLPCSMEELLDEMAASIKYAEVKMPAVKSILIQSAVYHNGGANAVQETAYGMSTAIYYIDAMLERGLNIEQIAKHIRFSFSLGSNFFMEIAKLRAAKLVWAQVIQAYGGSEDAQKIDIFARTSSFTKTIHDPYVNILRTTTESFAGVVGGINEMEVAPFDEAVGASDELSRRVARNSQIMMQNEFDLLQPVDPAGGSWYVESLTQEVAKSTWKLIQKADAHGGIFEGLKAGNPQAAINEVLEKRFKNLDVRADVAVGTNMYANTIEQPMDKDDVAFKAAKLARQADVEQQKAAAKDDVTANIAGAKCMVSAVAEAFNAGACTIRVRAALNKGEAVTAKAIAPHRWTEQFEAMRAKTEDYVAKTGKNVQVFLANYGPIPKHKPRADFSVGFLEVANFEILRNDGFPTAEEVAAEAIKANADVTVICGTDSVYPEIVPVIAKAVKAANPQAIILLAGAPAAEFKDSYDAAGVDDYIHVKANCFDILTKIQKARGIC